MTPRELLQLKRQVQICRLQGEPDEELERKLADAESALKPPRERRPGRRAGQRRTKRVRPLVISEHARKRMAQRRLTEEHVRAIWNIGERGTQADGRAVYQVTEAALADAMPVHSEPLLDHVGSAIVVEERRVRTPVLITVLAAGEDTRVRVGKGKPRARYTKEKKP